MGFTRRETALVQLSVFLGNARSVFEAMFTWTVKKGDRWLRLIDCFEDPAVAREQVHQLYNELFIALITYFDLPRWSRARQAFRWGGSEQQQDLKAIAHEQRLLVDSGIGRLRRLVQHAKTVGLPGGEAHRLDSYVSMMGIAFENLTVLKEYRTPQAFRAFARVYILLIGAMYGPYYVALGQGAGLDEHNLGVAIMFACGVQLALSGLFQVMLGLEDVFARRGGRGQLDSVRVPELLETTRRQLLRIERESEQAWGTPSVKEAWFADEVTETRTHKQTTAFGPLDSACSSSGT